MKNSSGTASIVIPFRDAERWLAACIDSALQCLGVTEVIAIDDGSTDGGPRIAAAYGSQIRLLSSNGNGGNSARNIGLHAATGEWLQFLDADDGLLPDKIETQIREAGNKAETADILYSPVRVETWSAKRRVSSDISALDPADDLSTQWIKWELPQTGGALWRRRSLEAIGGWKEDQPCCQEHELYLRAIQAGLTFVHCPTAGALYRIWSEKTVCRKDPVLVIREKSKLLHQMLAWLEKTGLLEPHHLAAAGQSFFEMARTWARHDLDAASAYFKKHRNMGLIKSSGPAAPPSYRFCLRLLGFQLSEQLAKQLRRHA